LPTNNAAIAETCGAAIEVPTAKVAARRRDVHDRLAVVGVGSSAVEVGLVQRTGSRNSHPIARLCGDGNDVDVEIDAFIPGRADAQHARTRCVVDGPVQCSHQLTGITIAAAVTLESRPEAHIIDVGVKRSSEHHTY
jgi:hypothetical protein